MKVRIVALLSSLTINAILMVLLLGATDAPATQSIASKNPARSTLIGEKMIMHNTLQAGKESHVQESSMHRSLPELNLPSALQANTFQNTGMNLKSNLSNDQLWRAELAFKESAVEKAPRIIKRTPPSYPISAKEQRIEGYVEYKLQINTAGEVQNLWLLKAEPAGYFEENASQALREFKFAPAEIAGQAVPVVVRQRLNFRLEE